LWILVPIFLYPNMQKLPHTHPSSPSIFMTLGLGLWLAILFMISLMLFVNFSELIKQEKCEIIVMDKKTYKEKQQYEATFLVWFFLLCLWSVESIFIYQVTQYRGFWLFWLFLFLIILIMLLVSLTNLRSGSQRHVMW
jgi:hypothetical protein